MKCLWLAASVVVSLAFPPLAAAQETHPQVQAIDPEVCRACHDTPFTANFEHSKHFKNGCATCHGPNLAEHAETGDKSLVLSFKDASASRVNEQCLTCHERGRQANWHGGVHDRRGLSCVTCHSVHFFKSTKSNLKTARDQETCFSCHPAIRSMTFRTSHHPIREGKIGCGDCHDPHDSTREKMISAESVNEKCYQCHTDKRGPFLWEHAPVRENCMNCHTAHGSNHDNLLVAKQPYLCQRCHLNTRHPGTLYDLRNSVRGAAPSNRAIEHSCRNCHEAVHGSNHPSGPYLGR